MGGFADPYSSTQYGNVFIVMQLMQSDLGHIIQSGQDLSNEHTQYFIYRILRGLKCIHNSGMFMSTRV